MSSATDPSGKAADGLQERYEENLETIKQERDWLKTLLDNLAEGVVACDADGTVVLMNRTARDWHGISKEVLAQSQWSQVEQLRKKDGITPLEPHETPLRRALAGENVHGLEVVIAAQGQPDRLVAISGNALMDDEDNQLGALVVMHDLAQRTRADTAEVELATQSAAAEARRREAIKINDRVVQSLVAAAWVWDDDVARARESLTKALRSASDIVGGTIGELQKHGELKPGTLRNDDNEPSPS
jgi:PAS domain S-box-containing protein